MFHGSRITGGMLGNVAGVKDLDVKMLMKPETQFQENCGRVHKGWI